MLSGVGLLQPRTQKLVPVKLIQVPIPLSRVGGHLPVQAKLERSGTLLPVFLPVRSPSLPGV